MAISRTLVWVSGGSARTSTPATTNKAATAHTPKKVFIHTVTINKENKSTEVSWHLLKILPDDH